MASIVSVSTFFRYKIALEKRIKAYESKLKGLSKAEKENRQTIQAKEEKKKKSKKKNERIPYPFM